MHDSPDISVAPERVCILRLSAIGDVCHTLPVVRTLQQHWPETQFTWIVGRLEHTLLHGLANIELVPFDKRGGWQEYRRIWNAFSDTRFDWLLHMQVALRASVLSHGLNATHRLGFDRARARDWQWLFTDCRIAARPQQHVMDGLFGFADFFGMETPDKPTWDLPLSDSDLAFASAIVERPEKTLVISPCSSRRARNFRNWPVERFIEVVRHAERELGMQVILTGGPSTLELQYGEAIAAASHARNLVGQTSLKQLAAILGKAAAVITPDSGPAHLANAMGSKVIGLYASSNPLRTGPWHHRELTVNRYPDAVKQYLGKTVEQVSWGQRVRHPEAMLLITVNDVIEKLSAAMRSESA